MIEKKCLHLSSIELDANKEVMDCIENFNKKVPHSHIFIKDGDISLLSVFYQSEKLIDTVTSDIRKCLNQKVKIKVSFQDKYYFWLLNVLKCAEAAENFFPGLSVKISVEDLDIHLRGYKHHTNVLKKILTHQHEKVN